ncbi:MAG TPA: MAPEG family protein [Steroidobacteraceae bacterium]|nr:MAPEG family protein [Steroidobacteraceae bacterium]
MSFPTITAFLAATYAILMVALSVQTSLRRRALRVSTGDGDDETLRRRIRAHGNFSEYAALALSVLALVELSGAARINVCALASAFLLARLLHAVGMLYVSGPALRAAGMILQHAGFVFGAVLLIKRAVY